MGEQLKGTTYRLWVTPLEKRRLKANAAIEGVTVADYVTALVRAHLVEPDAPER